MKKPWYKIIDFYRLTGLTLLWISSWLFMIPSKVNINAPVFNNIWGELLKIAGIAQNQNVNIQQTPDFISTLVALVIIGILQFRGIIRITTPTDNDSKSEHRFLFTIVNLLSIIVHTLFFTILIKIVVFPNSGLTNVLQTLHQNLFLTIFISISIAGMIFGAQSVSKILMILFVFVLMFKNISLINSSLGIWGFTAIISSVCGFYLEFIPDSFNRRNLLLDLNFYLGKYENIELRAKDELKKLTDGGKK